VSSLAVHHRVTSSLRHGLIALLLFSGAAVAAECAAPGATVTAPATGRLTLVSWNVHGLPFDATLEKRVDNIAAEIRRLKPDLVLLQEAWLAGTAEQLDCRLRDLYERLPDAAGVRSGLLSLYGHRRGGLLALVRRDSPWKRDASVEHRFTEYGASGPWYRVFEERDGIAGKGVQGFGLGDGVTRIAVLHTHLQAQYPGRRYEDVRAAQIGQLLEQTRQPGFDMTLLAGDLNTHAGEAALYGMLTAELTDLTTDYRKACGCGTLAGDARQEAHWIDYVLARPAPAVKLGWKVEQIRNAGPDDPYSDHHGLWLEMRIGRP
jgi:endonuclease/exonuclease/phosphatase family metal-dependent hydrolase